MVSAVQAVPNIVTANLSPAVGRFFQVVQGADSSLFTPSVIVSLGNTPTGLLVFNAAGVLQVAGTLQDAAGLVSTSTGSANTLLNPVTADAAGTNAATAALVVTPLTSLAPAETGSATIITALPAGTPAPTILDTATAAVVTPTLTPNTPVVPTTTTIPASSATVDQTTLVPALIATALAALAPTGVATPARAVALPVSAATTPAAGVAETAALLPAATVVATPAVAAPVAAAVPASADTTATAQDTVTPLVNTVVDPVVRASINIETNPAYASMAAGLYVSAMIYRTQRAMADTAHSAQPTGPVMPVAAVVANDQERGGDLRRNRSSWMR